MSDPSLLNIPYRFKASKLYSQIPDSGLGDFVVSRTTTPTANLATRVNASGFIETVADNVPRLDYPLGGIANGCPALLVEPSAQNLALHSRDLTNVVWVATNITPVKNAVGADNVASGATTLTATAANATILQSLTHASQSRIFSAYVRRVTGTGTIEMTTNGGTTWTAVTITSSYTRVACAPQTVTNGAVGFRIVTSGDVIVVDFCQGEVGPVATSAIPTTIQAITRGAETISKTGVSGLIGQTEGTMYAEFEYKTNIAEKRLIALSNGTASDRIMLWTLNNILYAQVEAGSIILASPITEGYHKVAFAYQQSGVSGTLFASLDGGGVVSGTSAAFPASLTDINIGKNEATATSTFFWNARIRSVAIYPTRLTNAQLQALTT
jgi:hypothetical protein